MSGRTLDWQSRHDPRSRHYPVRALLGPAVKRARKLWSVGQVTDQGVEGACVGHAFTGELRATPMPVDLSAAGLSPAWAVDAGVFAHQLYVRAQDLDSIEGANYAGTSVLAGAKAVTELGFYSGYRWAFGISDVVDTLCVEGPVVLGLWWYESLFSPDASGHLRVEGAKVGGHAIAATGYDPDLPGMGAAVRLTNSWGGGWGDRGSAWISVSDLAGLLADDGEACVPVGRVATLVRSPSAPVLDVKPAPAPKGRRRRSCWQRVLELVNRPRPRHPR